MHFSPASLVFPPKKKLMLRGLKKKRNLCNFIIHKSNYLLSNTTEMEEKVDERTEEEKNSKGGRKRLYEGVSAHKRPSHDVFKEL